MNGLLRIRGEPGQRWRRCGAALVRMGVDHEVDARGEEVLLAFVHSHSALGAALDERLTSGIVSIERRTVARWRATIGLPVTGTNVDAWVRASLLRKRQAAAVHPRVEHVLTYVRQQVATTSDLSLKTLASVAGLSPSRFLHVFTASVGVPPRPYIRWLRLQRAACKLMEGATITAAAYDSGFSDAAHLTRTFRDMMGMTPSDLALQRWHSRGIGLDRPAVAPPLQDPISVESRPVSG